MRRPGRLGLYLRSRRSRDRLHADAHRGVAFYLEKHQLYAEDLVARMHGRRNDDIVSAFFGSELSPEEIHAHGAAKEAHFRDMMKPYLPALLVPGITEFLNRCASVPTGLASNAEPANIDFVLDGAGIRGHFDAIVDG